MATESKELSCIRRDPFAERDAERDKVISPATWLKRRILSISPRETTFSRRGFRKGDAAIQERLERIGETFVRGYNTALTDDDPARLALHLDAVELEFRGFAFEGAAMALTLLDCLTPWNNQRLRAFLSGPASEHLYMVHVGVGWALARLRRKVDRFLKHADPLLGWLAVDGYGFHEGYFHCRRAFEDKGVPERLTHYARRVFDQGLGRSLWFVECANVERVPVTIVSFPSARHADLWSGIGLACAYAGGVSRAEIEALRRAAGPYRPQLAQGAAFAAKTRNRASNPAPHTELACEVLCGMSAADAASITDIALDRLPVDGEEPSYEIWRQRIQSYFAKEAASV
ncbi:MAG: DUF1702 family protein [Acidobacteriota bacterium]